MEGGRKTIHVCPLSAEPIASPAPIAITVFDPFVTSRAESPRTPGVATVGDGEGTGLGVAATNPLASPWRSGLSDDKLEATATPTPTIKPISGIATSQPKRRMVMDAAV